MKTKVKKISDPFLKNSFQYEDWVCLLQTESDASIKEKLQANSFYRAIGSAPLNSKFCDTEYQAK